MAYNPQNPNGQAASASSSPVVLSTEQEAEIGAVTETAPGTDTASSGLNGRLQRIAQRLTTMLTGLTLAAGSNLIGKVQIRNPGNTVDLGDNTNPVRVDPTGTTTQPVSAASLPLPSGAATETTLGTRLSESDFDTKIGSLTETAPATDTASSGLNGRLQRIAQRLTSIIALLPTALGAGGGLKVDGSGTALPVSAASLPLPTGAATETTLGTRLSESDFDTKTGSLTETAPATDTASSGLNGRLQRIAQRLTSLIALLPSALVGGRLDTNIGAWMGSTAPTVGQKTMANSLPVAMASDQTAIAITLASRQTFTAAPVAFTATTAVTSILAADASFGLDLVSLTIENNSATATEVVLYKDDGTTEVWRGYVPAGDMRGIVFPQGRELTQAAVNKAWKAKTVTSVSSVYITPHYIKNTAWTV